MRPPLPPCPHCGDPLDRSEQRVLFGVAYLHAGCATQAGWNAVKDQPTRPRRWETE